MTSQEIRNAFLTFFREKEHKIVPSAPMVMKNDPSLMFTNAGMNQFKDIFLGNRTPVSNRVTDTQKCLRVTGKHNDLEEVGHDTYHHTMFEMLGNWSFGDYFKKEAIDWAWEFLTGVVKIDPDRLYVTVFEGDGADNLGRDDEAAGFWRAHLPEERILDGSRKDNFWEMGDTGPCGPCSEIHVDIRNDRERNTTPGRDLVNADHPLVIEIWNLVFIQFNRKGDGSLENLPQQHVDTGMGFERLCMVLQEKQSNYDTDLFTPVIDSIAQITGIPYGKNDKSDIAMRVIADHLRAVSFSIAEGQLPSNNKAGYVIRRILRRAIRYGYTYLERTEPFIHRLVDTLEQVMGGMFDELSSQKTLIERVIREEENTFLKTLETGISMLGDKIRDAGKRGEKQLPGKDAFILYDTYGFPLDLTQLILREQDMEVDEAGFEAEMQQQKARSRKAASVEKEDWEVLIDTGEEEFVGYDMLTARVNITRYRKIASRGKDLYHLVFDVTPFYAESGGQVGDTGLIANDREKIPIVDTIRENELVIHIAKKMPEDPTATFEARVNGEKRRNTASNHTATHLLHYALRKVLGNHVEQKGSLVHPDYLRFDFSHFEKVKPGELAAIEQMINRLVRQNIHLDELRSISMEEAREMGAMALFGEKYGEQVRVIRFGDSVELCGGTHVGATGEIGLVKITRESAVAAGIRRIEAISGEKAEQHVREQEERLQEIAALVEAKNNPVQDVKKMVGENNRLKKQVDQFRKNALLTTRKILAEKAQQHGDMRLIAEQVEVDEAGLLRDLAFMLKDQYDDLFVLLGAEVDGKAHLALMISPPLMEKYNLDASALIREIARNIRGGGGGQPFFATAGGKNPAGIPAALEEGIRAVKG